MKILKSITMMVVCLATIVSMQSCDEKETIKSMVYQTSIVITDKGSLTNAEVQSLQSQFDRIASEELDVSQSQAVVIFDAMLVGLQAVVDAMEYEIMSPVKFEARLSEKGGKTIKTKEFVFRPIS